ncbi:MAG TPA: ATP-binding protein, partial [Bryobacteraceae bacterium]|nr:ATP-binding protein [Bryobacteraceae bacterium]
MRFRRLCLQVLVGVVADALLAAGCYQLRLNLATVSLVFLLSVVLQALSATFVSSVILALIAAAFVEYFFIDPVLTWRIASPFDVVASIVFTITTLVISRLASAARSEARESGRQRKNLEHIYQCSERLLRLDPETGVITGVLKAYKDILGLRTVCYFDGDTAESFIEGQSLHLAVKAREAYISCADGDDPVNRFCVRCIRVAGKVTGAIGFENLQNPDLSALLLVTLTAATLERAKAFQTASRATAEIKAETFRTAVLDALAHEFKTPLAVIQAAAGGLCETGGLTGNQRELAEQIEDEVSRLSGLTSRLLRNAQGEVGTLRISTERIDLESLLTTLVERFAGNHPNRNISFHPEAGGSIQVAADRELLSLVLGQLLDNAVKYSQPDSEIALSADSNGESVRVRVWNSGSSITAADRGRIFERFYRGANTRGSTPGSGLGLYAGRKIAHAHQGSLFVEGEESGPGTA